MEKEKNNTKIEKLEDRENNRTIMVVDNNHISNNFLSSHLVLNHYKVIKAKNAFEAKKNISRENNEISLVITDIELTDKDGFTLFQELYKENNKLKAIFTTNCQINLSSFKIGNHRHPILVKPIDLSNLIQMCQKVLNGNFN